MSKATKARKGKTSRKKIDETRRREQALQLRHSGATYQQIADALGYADRSNAARAINAALDTIIREPSEQVINFELGRLDRLLLGHWSKATGGDTKATECVLKILDRRYALLGVDKIQPPEQSTEQWTRVIDLGNGLSLVAPIDANITGELIAKLSSKESE